MSQARPGNSATRFFADRKVGTKVLVAVGSPRRWSPCGVGALSISEAAAAEDRAATSSDEDIAPAGRRPVAPASAPTAPDPLDDGSTTLVSQDDGGMAKDLEKIAQADDAELATAVAAYRSDEDRRPAQVAEFKTAWKRLPAACATSKLLPAAGRNDAEVFQQVRDTEADADRERGRTELQAGWTTRSSATRARRKAARRARDLHRAPARIVLAPARPRAALGLGLALFVTQAHHRPLRQVSARCSRPWPTGDLTQTADGRQQGRGRRQMAGNLAAAMESVRKAVQAMARSAQALGGSSEELTSVSTTIAASAEQAWAQANVVSAAAEQVSRNVQTVATGAEEMGACIREIAQNANEAARVAGTAVEVAHADERDGQQARGEQPGDRRGREGDHEHRGADEPAGAERDDRGGPGGGGRQGLRGRRERGEGAGAGDREGDGEHLAG